MALIYPNNPTFANKSEELVYNYLKDNLSNTYVCYFNYDVGIREFDIAILVPYQGIVIIEIKSWRAKGVVDIIDNNWVFYRTSEGKEMALKSPYKQVKEYRNEFKNILKEKNCDKVVVLPAVCYPNITQDEYKKCGLDKLGNTPASTIFKEDLLDNDGVSKKINEMFKRASRAINISSFYFDDDSMNNVREIFQTRKQIEESIKNRGKLRKHRFKPTKYYYSILSYIPSEMGDEEVGQKINELFGHWQAGTKLIIVTDGAWIESKINEAIRMKVKEMNLEKQFSESIYNFFLYKIEDNLGDAFEIIDGNCNAVKKYEEQLKVVHSQCKFNLNQYEVEHFLPDKNMIIKAGAGSGKTFSMIARIMYLIHYLKMTSSDLVDKIYLITFTNEAADNMKDKLQKELQNYYLITKDFKYFEMINAVEDMKISTIHSLAKKIIQRYSSLIGLGKDLTIVSGKHERRLKIKQKLNDYVVEKLNNDKDKLKKFRMTMYNIQEALEVFMEKMENKNIDILSTSIDLDDTRYIEFNELVKNVLEESEEEIRKELNDKNCIRLSDIIIKLRELIQKLQEQNIMDNHKVEYVFVDEFQDTDDIQIDLILGFKNIFNYKMFVVGDIKQCIYRFRGAEENAFDRLKENSNSEWVGFTLSKNYRTDCMLLNRFEDIFVKWGRKDRLTYTKGIDSLTSNINLNTEDDEYFKVVDVDSSNISEFEEKFINELKLQYERLPEKEVLAILVRENKEVEEIVKLGKKHNLTIYSDVGGSLYKIDPTLDFKKLIDALQNNKSPRHLFNLYGTAYVNKPLPKKQIYNAKKDKAKLLELFYGNLPIKRWNDYLSEMKREPILKVLRELVLEIKPWNNYASKHKDKDLSSYYKKNLDLLFEKLSQISNTDYLTLNKIEQYLKIMIVTGQQEETRASLSSESDSKKIKCMTVHKSKGLEFHTVMLPYTATNFADAKRSGPYDFIILKDDITNGIKVGYSIREDDTNYYKKNSYYKDEQKDEVKYKIKEETRILYVALTRAIKNFVYFSYKDIMYEECWQRYLSEG